MERRLEFDSLAASFSKDEVMGIGGQAPVGAGPSLFGQKVLLF